MSTTIQNNVQMSSKERLLEIAKGHLENTKAELTLAEAKYGKLMMQNNDFDSEERKKNIYKAINKCHNLEGKVETLEMIVGLIDYEL